MCEQELSRRTDTLIRLVEKEQEEYDNLDADEPKVRLHTCCSLVLLLSTARAAGAAETWTISAGCICCACLQHGASRARRPQPHCSASAGQQQHGLMTAGSVVFHLYHSLRR